jgi:hypothetical protein
MIPRKRSLTTRLPTSTSPTSRPPLPANGHLPQRKTPSERHELATLSSSRLQPLNPGRVKHRG